jgi:hypothetical protein
VFLFAKTLQAVGFAHVGIGLFLGVTRDDQWSELYLSLTGIAVFVVGRLLEPRS